MGFATKSEGRKNALKRDKRVSARLAVPGEIYSVGMKLPEDLSFEQWETVVARLAMITRACMWWIGDALAYGSRRYGAMYKQALDSSGYDYQTLRNAAWVSSMIELSRRRDKLSWSHHCEVAALEPEQQDALLDRAESENMSRDDLRRTVRELVRRAQADARLRANSLNKLTAKGCGRRVGPFHCCTWVEGNTEDLLLELPLSSMDAVISDGPYGLGAEQWDCEAPYHLLRRFLEVARGPVLWFAAAPRVAEAYARLNPVPERQLIWAPSYTNSTVAKDGIFFRYHSIFAWRLPSKHEGPLWDVIDVPTEGGANWWKHPCTKPVELMGCLCGFVPEGGLILDPFVGSGTTLVAARNRGRHFLGFEINPAYCEVIAQRLGASETSSQPQIGRMLPDSNHAESRMPDAEQVMGPSDH
jgi:hypothetical protein